MKDMNMNRLHALVAAVIVMFSLAAAPATKPSNPPAKSGAAAVNKDGNPTSMPAIPDKLPPLQYRAKKDAPAWVIEEMKRIQENREKQFVLLPETAKKEAEKLEEIRKSPLKPNQKSGVYSSAKGTTYKTAADKQAAIERHIRGMEVTYGAFRTVLDGTALPDITRDKENLKDWIEPIPAAEQAGK